MDIESLPGNSNKSKEIQKTEKRVAKPVVSSARKRPRGNAQKFADVLLPEDKNKVKDYIFFDVLVPAIKKGIYDIVTNGISMILYGESSGSHNTTTGSKISYRSYYDNKKQNNYQASYRQRGSIYNYDDVLLSTRGEAESILSCMEELIEKYGIVSVADMYDLCDATSEYTDNKYGWTDVSTASIVKIRDGFVIKMPPVRPLN